MGNMTEEDGKKEGQPETVLVRVGCVLELRVKHQGKDEPAIIRKEKINDLAERKTHVAMHTNLLEINGEKSKVSIGYGYAVMNEEGAEMSLAGTCARLPKLFTERTYGTVEIMAVVND